MKIEGSSMNFTFQDYRRLYRAAEHVKLKCEEDFFECEESKLSSGFSDSHIKTEAEVKAE